MNTVLITVGRLARRNAVPSTVKFYDHRKFSTPSYTMASNKHLGIDATPASGQHVWDEDREYTTVNEGLAYILVPASASATPQTNPRGDHQPQSVFYNPIQQFNRDLSVLAIRAYGEEVVERKRKHKANSSKNFSRRKRKSGRERMMDLERFQERLARLKSPLRLRSWRIP